jgi:hypothetical protein
MRKYYIPINSYSSLDIELLTINVEVSLYTANYTKYSKYMRFNIFKISPTNTPKL